MQKDTREELRRLEEALLEEPQPELPFEKVTQTPPEASGGPGLYRNFNGRRAYNADPTDAEALSRELLAREERRSLRPWLVMAAVELAAIAGVLLYWFFGMGGMA